MLKAHEDFLQSIGDQDYTASSPTSLHPDFSLDSVPPIEQSALPPKPSLQVKVPIKDILSFKGGEKLAELLHRTKKSAMKETMSDSEENKQLVAETSQLLQIVPASHQVREKEKARNKRRELLAEHPFFNKTNELEWLCQALKQHYLTKDKNSLFLAPTIENLIKKNSDKIFSPSRPA